MIDPLSDSLRWALQFGTDPAVSVADWLTREVVPESTSANDAVLSAPDSPEVDLQRLRTLKSAFKTLRLSGETTEDRRAGARYYAAVIAAAIVRHGIRITSQRPGRLQGALEDLQNDEDVSQEIRALSSQALDRIDKEVIPEDS